MSLLSLLLLAVSALRAEGHQGVDHDHLDLHRGAKQPRSPHYPVEEDSKEFWQEAAQEKLAQELGLRNIEGQAKNVIIFLGDGMGVSTLTAARVAKGQAAGLQGGEQDILSFEEFPHVALSRTYCVDSQVADSACSSTAYLGGVKGHIGTLGVSAAVKYKECFGQLQPENQVSSILDWARQAGKATGLVTTNSIVDASPAGGYAHAAYRGWYNDQEVLEDGMDPNTCDDIAEQLVRSETGRDLTVVMGGGRVHFLPQVLEDVEDSGHYG